MIEEQAIVVKCDSNYIWVQTQRQSSCGHCSVKSGCGTQVLSNVLGNKATLVRCINAIRSQSNDQTSELKAGDTVMVGMKESALLSGSLLIYFLPLISMMIMGGGAVMVARLFWPEGIDTLSIIFSFLGLFMGLYLAKFYLYKAQHTNRNSSGQIDNLQKFEPVVLKKISSKTHPVIMMMP